MALPWWLRGGLTGGAALLKEHLKKKGKELVGEARKKAIAKFAKKKKNGKKEKPEKKYTISRKELKKLGDKEVKRLPQIPGIFRERARLDSTARRTIAGTKKGDLDVSDFSDALLNQDIEIAKHVKGLQKLKTIRDYLKKQNIKKYTTSRPSTTDTNKWGGKKAETSKDIQQLVKKYEIDPKLAKPAKVEFQRIQKKKDRFKKKDDKKKGKQGD